LIDVFIKTELDPEYWNNLSENSLRVALNQKIIHKKAKNVIIFLGDGMGISTTTSARILKGQLLNNSGEESSLSFDNFPYISLIKVIISNVISIPIDIILQIINYLLFL
jgi:alkaline phosphatase